MNLSIEYFEYMDTCLSELAEWDDYEADMATNPYDDPWFD